VVSVTPRQCFNPGERTPGTHCTGGWVGPRAGLDTEARGKILSPLPGIEPRSSGGPARSQTLYRLSYQAHVSSVYMPNISSTVTLYPRTFCNVSNTSASRTVSEIMNSFLTQTAFMYRAYKINSLFAGDDICCFVKLKGKIQTSFHLCNFTNEHLFFAHFRKAPIHGEI
jgi:hypothetical protein